MLRPVLVGVLVAVCATVAHVAGGGTPAVPAVLLTGGLTSAVTMVVGARRLTTAQLLGLLLLGQAGLHVLTASGPHDAAMVAVHTVSTLLSLVVLRRAEDLWWRAADAVLAALRTPRVVRAVRRVAVATARVDDHAGRRAGGWVSDRAPPHAA